MARETVIAIGSYPDWDMAPMAEAYEVVSLEAAAAIPTLDQAVRDSARAVAFKGHDALGDTQMSALPALGIIANYGVGYDAIDVAAANARGVRVTNTPDVLSDDVADFAVALLLGLSREIVPGAAWVAKGRWSRDGNAPLNRKVTGLTAGIMGLGRIGREIADRLAAFKMPIHYHSRSPKDTPTGWVYHADPVALAAAADVLIVALVGGAETQGYVSRDVLAALGPDGLMINISRGTTIDEAALLDALEQKTIRGAGLDVFLNEPHLDPRFLALDNVLLQPHQGSATIETRQAMGQLQRDNIAAFFAGAALLTAVN